MLPLDEFVATLRGLGISIPENLQALLGTDITRSDDLGSRLVSLGMLTPWQKRSLCERKRIAIEDFIFTDELGSGSFGTVYKASRRHCRTPLAIKVFHRNLGANVLDRIERAYGELLSRGAPHENIVTIHADGKSDGDYYIIMEYANGESLKTIAERGELPVSERIHLVGQVARGLARLHRLRLVHGDVKPANIVVSEKHGAKVIDLDTVLAETTISLSETVRDREPRKIVGTYEFVSPEQAEYPDSASPLSDIYSLGCTVYFSLTGMPPYVRRDPSALKNAHQRDPIPKLSPEIASRVPGISVVLAGMLAKSSHDRYQSMEEVIADIDACLDGRHPTGPRHIERKSFSTVFSRLLIAVAVVTLICVAATVWHKLKLQPLSEVVERTADSWQVPTKRLSSNASIESWWLEPHAPVSEAHVLACSFDGPFIAAATSGGELRIYHSQTTDLIRIIRGHFGEIRCLAWQPHGESLAVADRSGMISIWFPDGNSVSFTTAGGNDARDLAWSPDGNKLAAIDASGYVSVCTQDGKSVDSFHTDFPYGYSLAWNPAGNQIVTGAGYESDSGQGAIRLWTADGSCLHQIELPSGADRRVTSLTWSERNIIAAGCRDGETITLIHGDRFDEVTLIPARGLGRHLKWNAASDQLLGGSLEAIGVFDFADNGGVTSGSSLSLRTHLPMSATAFAWKSSDGEFVVAGRDIQTFANDGAPGPVFAPTKLPALSALDFHPTISTRLAVGQSNGHLSILDLRDTSRMTADSPDDQVADLLWCPSGETLTTVSRKGNLRFFTDEAKAIQVRPETVGVAAWSDDGMKIATARNNEPLVQLWSSDGEMQASFDLPEIVQTLKWDRNNQLWIGMKRGAGVEQRSSDCELIQSYSTTALGLPGAIYSIDFATDPQRLLLGSDYGRFGFVRLTEELDHCRVYETEAKTSAVQCVLWSEDNSRFATLCTELRIYDANANLLNAMPLPTLGNWLRWQPNGKFVAAVAGNTVFVANKDGTLVSQLANHSGGINATSWSSDRRRLAVAAGNGVLHIWKLVDDRRFQLEKLFLLPSTSTTVEIAGNGAINNPSHQTVVDSLYRYRVKLDDGSSGLLRYAEFRRFVEQSE